MKRVLIALLASALASPAAAQHAGHHMPGMTMPMPMPPAKPAPKKPAAKKAAPAKSKPAPKQQVKRATARKPAAKPKPAADPHAGHHMSAPASSPSNPHAGHDMGSMPAQPADSHAGHDVGNMPAPGSDPHAGHEMSNAPARAPDPHAGHNVAPAEAPAPPVAPPPPAAFSGPAHAADTVFGEAEMRPARLEMHREHGDILAYSFLVDRLEARFGKGRNGYRWDAQGWIGGDIDKFTLKSEGEGSFGRKPESAEVQALWSHAIDPWFDLQLGLRHDVRPDPERTHLVLGVQGLAPYWFEIDAAAFLSNKGDVTARLGAEYDQRITQKLILQPRLELNLAAQDVPELGIGSGLSTAQASLRLRYEIAPEFAPYIGIEYERAFGDTRDFRRAAGERAGGWNVLLGLRTWF